MRCLFCKQASSDSHSREHVIPESLGNKSMVLPPGVVCDSCNNYFARKVERPVLESQELRYLRFEQSVENKRGRLPSAAATLAGMTVRVERDRKSGLAGVLRSPDPHLLPKLLLGRQRNHLNFRNESLRMLDGRSWSRFLAKVALESMAHRLRDHPDGLAYLVGERQLDPIREYARFDQGPDWPVNSRQIYCPDQPWQGIQGPVQRVWESDILVTDDQAWYFVLALFGHESAMNIGHRETRGYREWLWKHAHGSPLYGGDAPLDDGDALQIRHRHPRGTNLLIVHDPSL